MGRHAVRRESHTTGHVGLVSLEDFPHAARACRHGSIMWSYIREGCRRRTAQVVGVVPTLVKSGWESCDRNVACCDVSGVRWLLILV